MKYHELKLEKHETDKRLGRGIASGKGKTAGRGTKGAGARTGFTKRPGFTGGQIPLMQQLPKLPGFTSHRPKATVIYTGQLQQLNGTVDSATLSEHGLIEHPYVSVKVISGRGELSKKLTVRLQAASASAVAAIQQAGGSFEDLSRPQHPQSAKPKNEKRSKRVK